MNPQLILVRDRFCTDGIFGQLKDPSTGDVIAFTLEHSYDNVPKLSKGTYKCVRGHHRLHNMTEDFVTFEVTGVDGHTGILFHWGNYNKDSEGCILLGKASMPTMITSSRDTFAAFMQRMEGIDSFELLVLF